MKARYVIVMLLLCANCVTKKNLRRMLDAQQTKQDSTLEQHKIILNYEKSKIERSYENISIPDLLRRIDALTGSNGQH